MKKRTIYTLPIATEPTGEVLAQLIKTNSTILPTFAKLESYLDDTPVMDRETPNDILAIHNFADYIVSVNTGYMLGNPVEYVSLDEKDIDAIMDVYRSQNIYDIDSDLGEDCSLFGQAFENIYRDETGTVQSARLSVYNTIVVYDNTLKHNKLFAVYYAQSTEDKNTLDVTVWTKTHEINGVLKGSVFTEESQTEHFAGDVPVIHYMNNKRMKGDFEAVISLIDAYNILQSDRVIDREKLVDAILAFYGANLNADDQKAIKDNRAIGLPEGSKAEYLIKNIDEADADVLRQTLAADIHKFSKTPDLTDETFGDAPSGVSILYKLLAFEQNIKKKERQFEAGLRERFKVYSTILTKASKLSGAVDVNDISITFKRALPKNDFETSQMINNLEGVVSNETLIGQLSFVQDASKEGEKLKEQQENTITGSNFGSTNFPDTGV